MLAHRLDATRRSSSSRGVLSSLAPPQNEAIAALVRRAIARDRAASAELVERVLCPLIEARLARRLIGRRASRAELADRVQEVLLRLFADDAAALRRWDPARGSLATYVGTIAEHALISDLRRPPAPEPTEAPDDARSPDSGPESKAAFQSLLTALAEELGDEDFALFRLVYLEGLSPDEVASLLELRRETVYKRIQRLRPRLRDLYEDLSNRGSRERTQEQALP